ncbi:response regulator transcription factor [Candidatus Nitrospira bockiana]
MKSAGHDSLMDKSEFSHDLQGPADLRGGPGILILSTDNKLLHMNRRGWELIKQINEVQAVRAGGLLPNAVTEICSEIQNLLRAQLGSKDWEQLEVRRLSGDPKRPVLLRGFGLPGVDPAQHARVLIVMELMGRREKVAQQMKERFQLTDREQTVVQNLAKGLTNKEIAAQLGITEPTVKAHIKHIMEKTKCSTRTGIVAQVLR